MEEVPDPLSESARDVVLHLGMRMTAYAKVQASLDREFLAELHEGGVIDDDVKRVFEFHLRRVSEGYLTVVLAAALENEAETDFGATWSAARDGRSDYRSYDALVRGKPAPSERSGA